MSMEVKPNVAFTGSPELVEKFSGTAWKALWIIACPSIKMSLFLFIKSAAFQYPVCVYATGGNAALLSTNKAEALWTIVNFLELALAWTLVPSRVRRSK